MLYWSCYQWFLRPILLYIHQFKTHSGEMRHSVHLGLSYGSSEMRRSEMRHSGLSYQNTFKKTGNWLNQTNCIDLFIYVCSVLFNQILNLN